jgi:nucleoside-diphosphate-sugar epimerase
MLIKNSKILVTGSTGMLGSHLIYSLLEKGYKISATKRKTSNINDTIKIIGFYTDKYIDLKENINWIEADLTDYNDVEDAISGNDIVFNLAANVSFNPKEKAKIIAENTIITANIVNACLKENVKKLCHVSSIASIGESNNGELISEKNDKTNFKNSSGYSISKFESEMEVWRGISEGLNAVIINPSIILGPGNWKKGSPMIFDTVNSNLKYYTTGINGFVDVRDVVEILIELAKSDISEERYILNSENLSYKNIFDLVAENLNKPKPKIEAGKFLLETARILEELKYKIFNHKPKITKDTIKSAISNSSYSNEKIKNALNYEFIPIKKSISDFGKIFLRDLGL